MWNCVFTNKIETVFDEIRIRKHNMKALNIIVLSVFFDLLC